VLPDWVTIRSKVSVFSNSEENGYNHIVPAEILTTKLFVPPPRNGLVLRQRLIDRLTQGVDGKLSLISGPAGFGKTTLMSEWIAQCDRSTAWLSLDEGDNDPRRFLLYLISAFRKISEGVAEQLIELLYSSKPHEVEELLTNLINQSMEIQDPFLIVLDDYHVIDNADIHELMSFVHENQPPQMHLVIATRSDPPWPLARWRAQGDITEIRSQDLRFNPDESSLLLNEIMLLGLSSEDILRLDSRTEGWIAGLQMAALSMQGRDDKSNFIGRFTGSHRFVFDYLIDEVFDGLSSEIRDFLLKTSILDRMCAPQCDFILEQHNSQQLLEQLERMNLFVMPLDDQRSWYRYHHLFTELLRQLMKQSFPELMPNLHQKAREWYQHNDLIREAIYHGMAGADMDQVVNLIEGHIFEVLEQRDMILLTQWLERIPPEILRSRPWLNVAYARVLIASGSPDEVTSHLSNAEASLENRSDLEPEQGQHIRSYIASIRADLSVLSGDMERAIDLARQALRQAPQKDNLLRCMVASSLGTSLQRCGAFEDAAQAFAEGITAGRALGDTNAVIHLFGDLIGLHVERGQLHRAYASCQKALNFVESSYQKRGRYPPGAAYIHFRLSTILRHWNDLGGSLQYAKTCNAILKKWGQRNRLNFINLAIALHAIGDCSGAHQVLRKAEEIARQESTAWIEDVMTTQVLFWLVEGNLEAASQWALERDLDIHGEISFQDQHIYRTLAHVRLVQGQCGDERALDEILRFLPRLLKLIEESGAVAYVIQTLILQALALQAKGDRELSLMSLNSALTLGEPGGYIRVFVRAGEPMEVLLRIAATQEGTSPYKEKLLSAFESSRQESGVNGHHLPSLSNPLTARELEVLRCLDSHLTIPEIADSLVISVGTARTHVKRIYRKLDVHSRIESITRARELHLL
jgi:LuxR family maltose regulon positive regulatory protein